MLARKNKKKDMVCSFFKKCLQPQFTTMTVAVTYSSFPLRSGSYRLFFFCFLFPPLMLTSLSTHLPHRCTPTKSFSPSSESP